MNPEVEQDLQFLEDLITFHQTCLEKIVESMREHISIIRVASARKQAIQHTLQRLSEESPKQN